MPGDKSLGHRSLIMAAMAAGRSRISGLPPGADIASTRRAIEAIGVSVSDVQVDSPGIGAWKTPEEPIDCGNSGTTMRLLCGALAGSAVTATLVGDESLLRRPMGRIVEPLRLLGASVAAAPGGTAPLQVAGSSLRGTRVALDLASAQVRTTTALAALNAAGPTTISSPPGFRDHTERWLAHLGLGRFGDEQTFVVEPGPVPPLDVVLPGDPSSAAFLWTAAALVPGARVMTPGVSLNPGRTGILDILTAMGAEVTVEPGEPLMGDPTGTVIVAGGDLRGITVRGPLTTRTLDELPLVAVLGAAAEGTTTICDAAELQVKESDRIATGMALAAAAGGEVRGNEDGMIIVGGEGSAPGTVGAAGDHRVAMAGAVAALARRSTVTVDGFSAVQVSWPGFADVLEALWS